MKKITIIGSNATDTLLAIKRRNNDWRAVIDSLRLHTQTIWLNPPIAEKRYFMQHISRYRNVARHRMPPEPR